MSTPKPPQPAKLIVSVFMKQKDLFEAVFAALEDLAGPVDLVSQWMDFDFTDYYTKEMGRPLFRRLIAFKPLIEQDALAGIKHQTNALEATFCDENRLQINMDPGYLLGSRFILATGKEYSHRIYIGQNIYADLTLMYTKEGFKFLEWTYPDYKDPKILQFLEQVRRKYLLDLKAIKRSMV